MGYSKTERQETGPLSSNPDSVVWLWTSTIISLCLRCLICKMGLIVQLASRVSVRMKCNNIWKTLWIVPGACSISCLRLSFWSNPWLKYPKLRKNHQVLFHNQITVIAEQSFLIYINLTSSIGNLGCSRHYSRWTKANNSSQVPALRTQNLSPGKFHMLILVFPWKYGINLLLFLHGSSSLIWE